MLKKSSRYLISLAFSLALFQAPAFANSWSDQALELSERQEFSQALAVLDAQPENVKLGYDHRFLKARILSWSGDYRNAEFELNALNRDFPNNADVILAKGNLEYYQGNLNQARSHYTRVLELAPNYEDAKTGLANIKRAKASKKTWRIDGGTNFYSFNDDAIEAWDDQYLRAKYSTDTLKYSLSGQRYDRFGQEDYQFIAGLADGVSGGLDWGLIAGVTPGASFRPDFTAGINLGYALDSQGNVTFYPKASYRYDLFDGGNIHNVQTGLDAYFENGLVLTGDLIGTFQENGDSDIGWRISGRYLSLIHI